MTAKELNAALTLQRKIDRLQARLDDLRQTGGVGGTASNTPVQGGAGVFVGQIIAECSEELAKLQEQLRDEQAIIRRFLQKVEFSDVERKLMMLRYVECRPWRLVEMSLGYSHSRTMYIHSDILKKTGLDRTLQDLKVACQ